MTAPDKPGLSNEEFIKKWKEVIPTAEFVPERGVKLSIFMQALDRLEALTKENEGTEPKRKPTCDNCTEGVVGPTHFGPEPGQWHLKCDVCEKVYPDTWKSKKERG